MKLKFLLDRLEMKTDVKALAIKITNEDLDLVPTIGGEADLKIIHGLFLELFLLVTKGDSLYIRGGSPVQNKVLLDGMTVYGPFHSIGLFSVFDV